MAMLEREDWVVRESRTRGEEQRVDGRSVEGGRRETIYILDGKPTRRSFKGPTDTTGYRIRVHSNGVK